MNYVIATYLVRFVGILLVIPALMPITFANWFPGLEDRRIGWALFAIGVSVYIGASIAYHIFRQRERRKLNEREGN